MLWEGRPQPKDVVGWFLENSSFSKMQHRRFGRVGAVASDGHEHPSLALPLGSFSPKTHEKMAFTVTSSFSRRPIASTGGPLALLYLLRDGKICLEISTCRLAPFTRDSLCTCLQLEDREPYAGLGHADYAMAWDRSMPVYHCSVTNSNDTCAFNLPTYAVDPSRWGLPSLQSHSASPSYLTAWKEWQTTNLHIRSMSNWYCVLIFWYSLGTDEELYWNIKTSAVIDCTYDDFAYDSPPCQIPLHHWLDRFWKQRWCSLVVIFKEHIQVRQLMRSGKLRGGYYFRLPLFSVSVDSILGGTGSSEAKIIVEPKLWCPHL